MAVGAVLLWRDRHLAAAVAGGLGIAMALAAIVIPTRLGPVERGWMALARGISRVTTPVFMALVYYVTVVPIGVVQLPGLGEDTDLDLDLFPFRL